MDGKPLRWLHGEVKTPPMSREARWEIGMLLRDLQEGLKMSMPQSRPMPVIGPAMPHVIEACKRRLAMYDGSGI